METKRFEATEVKAEPSGEVTVLLSTFNKPDKYGDVARPGAFMDTIKAWRASGDPVPLVFSHQSHDPRMFLGQGDPNDWKETATGLIAKGRFDLDDANGAKAFKLVRDRRLREWSFAFNIKKANKLADGTRELLALDLLEFGPCLRGVGDTATIAVKATTDDDRRRELARVELAPHRLRLDLAQRRLAIDLALARGR